MQKNTGGSAFPVLDRLDSPSHEYRAFSEGGMSLRDYFAAKALAGLVASPIQPQSGADMYARDAYKLADAMLAERAK